MKMEDAVGKLHLRWASRHLQLCTCAGNTSFPQIIFPVVLTKSIHCTHMLYRPRICRYDQKQNTSPRKRARQARTTRAQERHVKKIRILEESGSGTDVSDTEEFPQLPSPAPNPSPPGKAHILIQANLSDERTVFIPNEEGHSIADVLSEGRNEKATQVHLNKNEKSSSASASVQSSKPLNLAEVLTSDSKLFTFTGIHSLDLLESLVKCVQDIDTVHTTSKKALSLRNRTILTMIKIKLNMSFTAIGNLFDIDRHSCARYFRATCPLLAAVLEEMIPWPEQEEIRCNLPLSFKNYKKTRIVLDCAETPLEICECLKCRVLTYSQYKKRHSVKYCVGITPSGLITFISKSFGGRASDKPIVNQSGILDKLEPNDIV